MARFFRVSLLAAMALVIATGALANIPDPNLSTVPDVLTVTPDGSFEIVIVIQGAQGPVNGSFVEIEFSPVAGGPYGLPQTDGLIAWSDPIPAIADVPTGGPGGGFLFSGNTSPTGEIRFRIAAAGCVAEKVDDIAPYVAQVRADNIVMNECYVNSPDVVDALGALPEDLDYSICNQATGSTSVGLADALFHTPPISQGQAEVCSKFTAPYDGPVGIGDATVLTPYVKAGTGWTCTYVGP